MPTYDYDLAVIGGGAAGLTAAGIAATLGAKTLLVERERLGGDCTWTGCVPSKTLLKAAKVAGQIRQAHRFGLPEGRPEIDFPALIRHVHQIREDIYRDADAPERFEAMGVTVRHGAARFLDDHVIEVAGADGTARISSRRFVIATGGRPAVPPIDGLAAVPVLTSTSLFEIEQLPRRLLILGGGPVGVEMAQAFRLLGSAVTVIDREPRILPKDDPDLTAILQQVLAQQGVHFRLGAAVERVARDGSAVRVDVRVGSPLEPLTADALLVAAGRRPNTDDLGLDAAGVVYDRRGIVVDDRCRTSQRHIFAAGDVTGRYQLTHMSEHMAKVAVTNALLRLPMKLDARHVPWVTYTDPELGHVGATERALQQRGTRYDVYRFPYDRLDRALADGAGEGLVKVFATTRAGKILGASIVGAHAGELIGAYAVAMRHGVTLRQLSDTIFPYPTYLLGARRAADQWYVRRYAPRLVRALQKLFGYRGPVQDPDPDRIV